MERNIYQRIIRDIEQSIIKENYRSGRKLPSVRVVCEKYRCSKNTVVKAYEILKNRHIIYSVPQSGYFTVENLLKNETNDSTMIDFSTGNPLIGTMHIPDLKHCLDRAVDIYRNHSLCRDPYGVESLRNFLTTHLADFQVFTHVDNLFVNSGIQQVLSILTQMPFPNGKETILIEQPTYRYYADFLKFNLLKKHVTSMRKELRERLKCLRTNFIKLSQYGIDCIGGESGFYSYLKLPETINDDQLVSALQKQRVRVTTGRNFYWDNSFYKKGIHLSIARTDPCQIDRGFEIIGAELENTLLRNSFGEI